MTDKPFDHEEHTRERLRQTTDKDKLEAAAYFAGQTTPGAGKGERWEKFFWPLVPMGATYAIREIREGGRIVASHITEADADLICSQHNEREADQQGSITDCEKCGSGSAVNGLCAECRYEADQQTIARLQAELNEYVTRAVTAESGLEEAAAAFDANVHLQQTIAELRTALQGLHTDDEYVLGLLHVAAAERERNEELVRHAASLGRQLYAEREKSAAAEYDQAITSMANQVLEDENKRLEALAGQGWRAYVKHHKGCGYLVGEDCTCGLHALIDQANALITQAPEVGQ